MTENDNFHANLPVLEVKNWDKWDTLVKCYGGDPKVKKVKLQ
jgi:hypothetical protein